MCKTLSNADDDCVVGRCVVLVANSTNFSSRVDCENFTENVR